MRRPFLRPVRTWTASSSPRLTRCNTVWRETPSARIASTHRQQPAGASSTKQGAKLVGDADAPRGAGGELLAGDEAVVEPAVQGGGSDAEDVGRLGDRDGSPSGGSAGGW